MRSFKNTIVAALLIGTLVWQISLGLCPVP
jgi:hypothetical protein